MNGSGGKVLQNPSQAVYRFLKECWGGSQVQQSRDAAMLSHCSALLKSERTLY